MTRATRPTRPTLGRLRRRSIIGALPVVVLVLAWRAQPGTYPFDAVRLDGPPLDAGRPAA